MSTLDRDAERRQRAAEDLYRHGRAALAAHERDRAHALLQQAVDYDRGHSQAWLWLTATTDDPAEQKQYLDWAIAADPGNTAARRGLGLLTGQIKAADLAPAAPALEPSATTPEAPAAPEIVIIRRTFVCPRCGGRLRFDPALVDLRCEHCGYVEGVTEEPLAGEAVLDFTLPTRQGHRWAEAERRFTCGQCGAGTLLPVGVTSPTCPFCSAAALVAAPEEAELLPPQGVIPMALEAETAQQRVRAWLGQGRLAPDDLRALARRGSLQPVYVPFWRFNSALTTRWRAKVTEGAGRAAQTVWREGEETFFYPRWLQAGTRALPRDLVRQIEPYNLDGLVRYKPEYLAGWPAGTYDLSLAEASLAARAGMLADATRQLERRAPAAQAGSEWQVTSNTFTGQTYQLVLLPLWVGHYGYRGRRFRVLVNGQTGQVAGDRPVDGVKVALLAAMGLAATLLVSVAAWLAYLAING
ncbi:MAG: hypothetical protein IT317_15570 [Anaerolineales bacterium]|nr:hypothetical protein [Anaerolineales bacterium]